MKLALMLGSFAVGLVLMVGFEHVLTRVLGLLALFTFIVMGVFLVINLITSALMNLYNRKILLEDR